MRSLHDRHIDRRWLDLRFGSAISVSPSTGETLRSPSPAESPRMVSRELEGLLLDGAPNSGSTSANSPLEGTSEETRGVRRNDIRHATVGQHGPDG